MHFFLDRYEDNDWAVLERPDGETFFVPVLWVPEAAVEGDVLRLEHTPDTEKSTLVLTIGYEEKERRLKAAQAWYENTPKVGKGNIEL